MRKPTYDARAVLWRQERDDQLQRGQEGGKAPEEGDAAASREAAKVRSIPLGSPHITKEQIEAERKEERFRRHQRKEKKEAGRAGGGGGRGQGRGTGTKPSEGNRDRSRSNRDIRDFAGGESRTAAAMRGAPGPKAPYTGGFKALDPSPKPPKPSPLPRDKIKS